MERERNKITSVCVYCASSTQVASAYLEAATELGHLLGERNLRVINGAGNSGLMCAVSDAALAAGGTVTGVIPRFMVEQDWCHKGLTDLVEVDSMHERKQRMADLSDAVIALPGGCGTLEELLEVITWKQLGLYLNPIVILNINGNYEELARAGAGIANNANTVIIIGGELKPGIRTPEVNAFKLTRHP